MFLEVIMKLICFITFLCFVVTSNIICAEENKIDGYFWEKFTPREKYTFIVGYVEGISFLNLEIRHQMDVLVALYDMEKTEGNKYLSKYGKETKDYYENNYQYFGIPYRQLIDGLDKIYSDFKNKSIKINDALFLVKSMLEGTNEQEIERRMIFLRKSEEEQQRILKKEYDKQIE